MSVPSTLETLTGPLEASFGEVTSADKVKRSRKESPRVWRLPPQSQGSEPWRGVEPKTEKLSEFGKRTPGGSQTLGNRVWCGPDHTGTVPRPEDRSGGAPEREEPVDLTAQSLGLKGISPRSPAEKATEPSSVTTSSSPESLRETSEVIVLLSVKRKALT